MDLLKHTLNWSQTVIYPNQRPENSWGGVGNIWPPSIVNIHSSLHVQRCFRRPSTSFLNWDLNLFQVLPSSAVPTRGGCSLFYVPCSTLPGNRLLPDSHLHLQTSAHQPSRRDSFLLQVIPSSYIVFCSSWSLMLPISWWVPFLHWWFRDGCQADTILEYFTMYEKIHPTIQSPNSWTSLILMSFIFLLFNQP